jgi:hypothetical protein
MHLPTALARVRAIAADSIDRNGRPVGPLRMVTGTLASSTGDVLRITADAQTASTVIPTSHVVELYESDGFHSHVRTGALVGLGVGAAVGFTMGYTADYGCSGPELACFFGLPLAQGAVIAASTVVAGLVGTGVGALIGSSSHEHWRQLSQPRRLSPLVAPSGGGSRLGLALRL